MSKMAMTGWDVETEVLQQVGDAERHAFVEVRGPDGERLPPATLAAERVSVGRSVPANQPDIALVPDLQQLVSRVHCEFWRDGGVWWITDNDTPNGTFLRQGEDDPEQVVGRRRLNDGDVICILGALRAEGPHYWELVFHDPFATRRARARPTRPPACVEYDQAQAKLFRRDGSRRQEVPSLSPKAHQLIRYMVARSLANGVATACTHDELIRAVWGDTTAWRHERSYTRENLRDLVSDVRQRLEPCPASPRVLEAVPGYGYRLVTCTVPSAPPPG